MRKSIIFAIILCLLGIFAAGYLTYSKYTSSTICDISNFLSCTTVNSSIYSTLFNIPLSILGLIYFIFMLIFFVESEKDSSSLKLILLISVPVFIYSLYLTYIEIFVLNALCVICEFSKILMLLIIIIAWKNLNISDFDILKNKEK